MATGREGQIGIIITGDERPLRQATQQAEQDVARMASEIGDEGDKVDATFKKMGMAVGAFFGIAQATSWVKQIAAVRGQYQQLEVAFETMLQSQEKSNKLMRELTDTAARTPFGLQDVTGGAKQLLAYGFAAEEVNQTLIELGNIAAGLSVPLNDLVYLYGTTRTQGRVYTQDMRQFMGRGIPLAEELAKQLGKTKNEINEMVTAGKIGFPEVEKAIKSMSGEGGKFFNLMEKQSHTITGQISNIEDAFQMMLNDIGQKSEGVINSALGAVSSLIENYEKVGRVLVSIAEVYGVYKMACMAVAAAQAIEAAAANGVTLAQLAQAKATKVLTIAQKALNKAMLSNPYVLVATAVAGLCVYLAKLNTYQGLVAKQAKASAKAQEEFTAGMADEEGKLARIANALKTLKKGSEEWNKAKQEAIDNYGSYFKNLDAEIEKTGDLSNAYAKLRDSVTEMYRVKAWESYTSEQRESVVKDVNVVAAKIRKVMDDELGDSQMKDILSRELGDYLYGGRITAGLKQFFMNYDNPFNKIMASAKDARDAFLSLNKIGKKSMSLFGVTSEMADKYGTKSIAATTGSKEEGSDVAAELAARKKALEQLAQLGKAEAKKRASMTFAERQESINAMQEGTERTILQIRLDGEKERAALREQQDETLRQLKEKEKADWLAKHPGGDAEKDFKSTLTELPEDWKALYDKAYALVGQAEQDKFAEMMNAMAESEREIVEQTERQIADARDAYLSSYGTYAEKRNALIERYDDAIVDAAGKGEAGQWLVKKLDADKKAALEAMDMQNDSAYRRIFGDPAKMTSSAIAKALDMARAKLKTLKKEASPEAWKALVEAIDRLESAQDAIGFERVSTGLDSVLTQLAAVSRLQARIAEEKAKGEEADKAELEVLEDYLDKSREKLKASFAATGADYFASALQNAAAAMQEIAELTDDNVLADASKALNETAKAWSNIINATAQGGPVAGFAQAVMDALSRFVKQFVDIAKVNAQLRAAAESYRDFAYAFNEGLVSKTGDSIFGENAIRRVSEAYKKAAEARDRYMTAGLGMERWDAKNGAFVTHIMEQNKKIVKELTGKRGTATLAELFPGIFDENGDLVLEKAKEALSVLETKKDSSTSYVTLKNAIEEMEVFQENAAIVDDYLSKMFSNLGDEVADAILSGADAFDVLQDSAADFMNEFAKDYIKSLLMTDDFKERYTIKLREAIASGDAATLAAAVAEMNADLEGRIAEATAAANALDEASAAAGINAYAARQDGNTGIAQASQDSVNELNGRFTAIQMYTANIAGDVAEMAARSSQILQQLMGIRTNTDDIAAGVTAIRRDVADIKYNM